MQKPVTMKDIAKRLSVTSVTVSKALSGKEGVSDELRKEIIQAAKEMGYRKHLVSKESKEGSTHNVGILISERHMKGDCAYMRIQQEICRQLLQNGYYGIVELVAHHEEEEGTLPKILQDSKVDGLILLAQMRPSYVNRLLSADLPYIFVDFFYENYHADAVICDNVYGGYSLTNHLISLGHRNIVFVGNPMYSTVVMDRYLGYYKALMEHGLTMDSSLVIHDYSDFGERNDLVINPELATAYVCSTCETAYRLMKHLQERGVKVPEQASIVGFDEDLYTTLSNPPLTTFSIDIPLMALSAAQSIVSKIENPEFHFGRKTISGSLEIRQSSSRITPADWDSLNKFG
ncbi:MAG: substrate-binding domain-containing protein [Sphaerochaeta sp.]|nr:substrate-binding domain-containing protein [Sphaerochaeta sp.]MDD4301356.1 substrate-binding domain-containing protein [Sphaerochaeta sp.]MDY0243713.1 substrate-binding domain-containing protein [Sphaerochaeta sp.]